MNPQFNPLNLKVGDKIRLVEIDHTKLPEETEEVLHHILATKRIIEITEIAEDGIPWTDFEIFREDGVREYHCLSTFDDKWEKIDG